MTDTHGLKKIVKAFATVSQQVVAQMTRCKIKLGEVYEKKHSYPSYEFSFIIGVTGGYEGAITMSLKEGTAFFIASAMMGNKEIDTFDELAESAVRELSNMTVAQAFMAIEANGAPAVNITPPTFVRGTNISLAVSDIKRTFVVSLDTPGGAIEFNISLIRNSC